MAGPALMLVLIFMGSSSRRAPRDVIPRTPIAVERMSPHLVTSSRSRHESSEIASPRHERSRKP